MSRNVPENKNSPWGRNRTHYQWSRQPNDFQGGQNKNSVILMKQVWTQMRRNNPDNADKISIMNIANCQHTSNSWLRAAMELSSLKSIRDVAKVRKKLPSEIWMTFLHWLFIQRKIRVRNTLRYCILPLIMLWKSWGKMPLGASWWNTQRRNCLATPAAFPGIIMLKMKRKEKRKKLHCRLNTCHSWLHGENKDDGILFNYGSVQLWVRHSKTEVSWSWKKVQHVDFKTWAQLWVDKKLHTRISSICPNK